jgi:hypothetical protein
MQISPSALQRLVAGADAERLYVDVVDVVKQRVMATSPPGGSRSTQGPSLTGDLPRR